MGNRGCTSQMSNTSILRKRSNGSNSSALVDKLQDVTLRITIELSTDIDYQERCRSIDWFVEELKKVNCNTVVTYKLLHNKKGEFYVYVHKEKSKKIVMSNSNSHIDAVTGNFINKRNFYLILENATNFLEAADEKLLM